MMTAVLIAVMRLIRSLTFSNMLTVFRIVGLLL